ncbi:cytochrome P450 [Epithele typhae]|uniref:cytochrome P450 n=1 Tax=Epithele typhae TaxID=378194 RepID=UPI0020081012|nr:cytochrome P450 [Epithele typhae]KAH9940396.1 cytochrome P450 [Epithele typhae]
MADKTSLILLSIFVIAAIKVVQVVHRRYFTPVGRLRGPPSESLLFGNMRTLNNAARQHVYLSWADQWGSTFRINSWLSASAVFSLDPKLIHHVLTHDMIFWKTEEARSNLSSLLGKGALFVPSHHLTSYTAADHGMVDNPAFGPTQVRELTEIFLESSTNLVKYWTNVPVSDDGSRRIETIDGLGKMTLDVIGLAGFDYEFDAMNPAVEDPVRRAFKKVTSRPPKGNAFAVLRLFIPSNLLTSIVRRPFGNVKAMFDAQNTMMELGRKMLEKKKSQYSGGVEKRDVQGRDLLSLLFKANMATDIPEDQRLSDEEVLAQVPTFLIAGHETTSTSTTWCLYALCKAPHIQAALREELLAMSTDMPTMEELNGLPLLDRVVRETLRLHAPVTMSRRTAMEDDVLPLQTPIVDLNGKTMTEVPVKKGELIVVPILALNTSKAIWGPDAFEFNPDRWLEEPEAASTIPGVWGHLMTFLGGQHACIGYRFSVVEMKALVFTLIRAFEFEFAVPADDIVPVGLVIQRPGLNGAKEEGAQLPLLIRPIKRE